MKTKLKSILAVALCAVGLSAFAEEPAGSEGNPWLVGTPNEADVKAWTNGTGKLTIEGTGAMMDCPVGDPAPWYNDRKAITTVEIKSGVTRIGQSAFQQCSVLESVTIPSSVTSIGMNAFNACKGLKSVTIPSGVTSLGIYTFSYCSGLESVTIPSSVTSIGNYAFSNCSGLESVTIPSSVTNIGNYAFQDCKELKSFIEMREEPPTAGEEILGEKTSFKGKIYVPMEKLKDYKKKSGWITYQTKMVSAYLVSGVAEHGAVEMSKNCFPTNEYTTASETVTVTVTPDEGYLFKSLVWNDGTDHDITETKSFTMPLACVTVTAVFEAEQPELAVANVKTATHWPWDGKIDITCDLTGAGIVQLGAALTTNGVTVCTATAENVTGATEIDLDQVGGVTNGVKFTWDAKADCPADFNSKDTKVKVTAKKFTPPATVPVDADGFDTTAENVAPYYSTTFIPGDYCVVDLTTGEVTEMKNVQKADTFNTDDYKTTKMAFRWVPAGKFKAVCAKTTGYKSLVTNDVTLSACWIAVFHVTEAQFNAVMGGDTESAKPKVSISWDAFRGGTWGGWDGTYANVPAPGDGTFVKALNDKVAAAGCADTFDLCTSFQWERAARAGTRTDYFFSDKTATTAVSEDSGDFKALYDYAWFAKSGKSIHDVGGKLPNAWGLYDVYGNINDWCLDWYERDKGLDGGKKLEDYVAAISDSTRVCRGGNYTSDAGYCSSVVRNNGGSGSGFPNYGFRLVRKPAAK